MVKSSPPNARRARVTTALTSAIGRHLAVDGAQDLAAPRTQVFLSGALASVEGVFVSIGRFHGALIDAFLVLPRGRQLDPPPRLGVEEGGGPGWTSRRTGLAIVGRAPQR